MDPLIIYGYLTTISTAILPIYIASHLSIKQKTPEELVTKDDALWFPVIGSITLFSLYLAIKYLDKIYIEYFITGYLSIAATLACSRILILCMVATKHRFTFVYKYQETLIFKAKFGLEHIFAAIISCILTVSYLYLKTWWLNNIFGFSLSVLAIELIAIDRFYTGFILLGGLFIYDVFWVFGTNVMVSVAKGIDAPIKMVWPKDPSALLSNSKNIQYSMLGLGDIVIPGLVISLCLRYDYYRCLKNKSVLVKHYFNSALVAYFVGLTVTVIVMNVFKAAQVFIVNLCLHCFIYRPCAL